MTVPRVFAFWVAPLLLAVAPLPLMARPQDPEKKTEESKPDNLFSGTVIEFSKESITISRKVLGKTEKKVFRVTPDTKCDGEVKVKIRVTVRYILTDDGEAAESIFVRPQEQKKK